METEYIHLEYSKPNWYTHASRTAKHEPKYLLNKTDRKPNEFWESEKSDRDLWNENMALLKGKRGKRPLFKNCQWCGVMLLHENNTMDDVWKVAKWIEDNLGYTCTALAIHRDEGHVDKKTGQVVYNLHAHLHFFSMKNGVQMAREVKPSQFSELQDITAEVLGMKRGQKGSKSHHFKHQDYRVVAKERELQQEQVDDLKKQYNDLYQNYLYYKKNYAKYLNQFATVNNQLKQANATIATLNAEKAEYETQLKDLQILKNKREYLRKGGLNYRRAKKQLKAQISALNLKIEGLNKSVATLTADKADLSSKLENAKGQILSDQQKADLITNAIGDLIAKKAIYTKQDYDSKEVTKTVKQELTADEIENLDRVKELKDKLENATAQIPTDKDKQDLIDNAIKAKIEQGDLFTKEQYDNKPLTQEQIKDYVEKNRQAMRQAGIYTADDYKKLGELKKNLIEKLRLAKKEGFQFTEQEVVDSVTDLMTALENSKKQAQNDLTKAISAYTTFKPKGDTAYQTIKDLSEQINARIEKVEKERFNEGVKADREYLNKHLNENPQLLQVFNNLLEEKQALENATPTPVEVEVIKEVPRELNAEEIEQLPRVQNLLKEIADYKSQIDDYKSQSKEPKPTQSVQVETPKPQEPQVEIEPYVPDTYESYICPTMPEENNQSRYTLDDLLEDKPNLYNRIIEKVCVNCDLNSYDDNVFNDISNKMDDLRVLDLNKIPNLDINDDFAICNEISKIIIEKNSDLKTQKIQILSKKGRSR